MSSLQVTPFTYGWCCSSVSTIRQSLTGTTSWEMSAPRICSATLYSLAVRVTSSPSTSQWLPGQSLAMAVQGLWPRSGCLGGRLGHWLILYGVSASAWCRNTGTDNTVSFYQVVLCGVMSGRRTIDWTPTGLLITVNIMWIWPLAFIQTT